MMEGSFFDRSMPLILKIASRRGYFLFNITKFFRTALRIAFVIKML